MLRCAAWGPRWLSSAAGARTRPELVDGLCDVEDRMVVDDLVLLDPSDLRREVVGGLSERILRARGWSGTFSTTADPHAALEGADFVVVQLRIGGQAARHVDETLPVGYGCLGQETTGAGGLAKALRTVPIVLELAEEMAARSNPRRVAGRLHQSGGDRDAGLAGRGPSRRGPVQRRHLGPATDRALSRRRSRCRRGRARGAEPPHVDQVGPGRRGRRRWRTGRRLDDLFERFGPELELESGIPIDLLRLQHALPSYYVHYYYQHDAEVAQQSAPGYRSRADVVAELETKLLEEYRDPALGRRSRRRCRTAAAPSTRWPPCA